MALAHDHLKADGPHVALLHAGVADRRVWRDVAPELHALGADVLALDRRGFGETPAGEGAFRHVDDLLEMLDGPTWLVGNSMGGALALDAALVAPEQVAGLVLIAPAVSGAPEGSLESLDPDTARIIQAIMAADEAGDLDAVNRHEAHLWLDGPSSPEGRVGGDARELALDMNAIALRSGARGGRRQQRRRRLVAPGGDPRAGDDRLGRARRAGRSRRRPRARTAPPRRPAGGRPARGRAPALARAAGPRRRPHRRCDGARALIYTRHDARTPCVTSERGTA